MIDRLGDDARRDAANAGLRKKVAARGADEKHAAGTMVARSRNPRKQHFLEVGMVACARCQGAWALTRLVPLYVVRCAN